MRIPIKQLKNGFKLPVYGLGTWEIGGSNERDFSFDVKEALNAIQRAISLGITHIDTAEAYAEGFAEEIIGQVMGSVKRDQLFLTSKVLPQNLKYQDLINACKNSLKRLNTEYLDLYLIHRPNPKIDLEETMSAVDSLIDQGLVINIGVSNFTNENLAKAQKLTKNKIVVNQVHYNLIHREIEEFGVLEYCQKNDIFLTAYSPIQKGLLSTDSFELLNKLSDKYHKTVTQIAINWLISQPNVVTIAKTLNIEHLKENLAGLSWKMDIADIELLRRSFPNQVITSKSYLQDQRNNYL